MRLLLNIEAGYHGKTVPDYLDDRKTGSGA